MPKISDRKQTIKDLQFMWLFNRIKENHKHISAINITRLDSHFQNVGLLNNCFTPQYSPFHLLGPTHDLLGTPHASLASCTSRRYLWALVMTLNSRYLSRPLNKNPLESFDMDSIFNMRDDDFWQGMRTSKEGFVFIYEKIKNHAVFTNNSTCKQLPIAHQLALTLERLGSNGNGGSVGKFARNFQVGQGTVISTTRRTEGDFSGNEGCIGFIDGTTFPLYQKPAWQGEFFFDWKKNYSLNAQILCYCDKNITAITTGWPGSCADYMVYRNMGLFTNTDRFFDKAYPLNDHLIPAIRAPAANTRINTEFSFCLAKSRVRNEHAIGILKGRWASLREKRLQLHGKHDIVQYVNWIKACCILHNMLSQLKDSWVELSKEVRNDSLGRFPNDVPSPTAAELQRVVIDRCVIHNYELGDLPIT
ncbi:hypothetical protein O181_035973 [Austropuccinia psidii MF-1]|uniref:DDE Tnp4 domain-containing protein n=1 Tax=Austropuccinia psidii MF-1 TaxID=1389203 RepID=A0A9Q3D8K1_9BASI|nr:hypothetical protein [Austropuccinia psidii MF-1]